MKNISTWQSPKFTPCSFTFSLSFEYSFRSFSKASIFLLKSLLKPRGSTRIIGVFLAGYPLNFTIAFLRPILVHGWMHLWHKCQHTLRKWASLSSLLVLMKSVNSSIYVFDMHIFRRRSHA